MDPYLFIYKIKYIPFNNSTPAKNYSYFSLFFAAASLTIWLNVSLSSEKQTESVFALIVAALGTLYRSANSPKDSPG